MAWLCAVLVLVGLAVSTPATYAAIRVGRRLGALDSPGAPGHEKVLRPVPNTGGIGLFLGVALPMSLGLAAAWLLDPASVASGLPAAAEHLPGVKAETAHALTLLACLAALHAVGLVDDRRALRPGVKAAVMLAAAVVIVLDARSRLFTFLDAHAGGPWLSMTLTILWFVAVTNAMNFIDNMDGLSAGVGLIAASGFLAAALMQGQWFVAATLALLVGSLAGFLVFNLPPARVFMGDGGSLVLGFLLAFLTVRTTYFDPGRAEGGEGAWSSVFMPLVILAVPLYDLVTVTVIRLWQGRSPFVGSQQHVSHRLVKAGLSRRAAVLVLWGFTAVTGMSGVLLASLQPWQAVLVGAQTAVLLGVIAMLEWRLGALDTR